MVKYNTLQKIPNFVSNHCQLSGKINVSFKEIDRSWDQVDNDVNIAQSLLILFKKSIFPAQYSPTLVLIVSLSQLNYFFFSKLAETNCTKVDKYWAEKLNLK